MDAAKTEGEEDASDGSETASEAELDSDDDDGEVTELGIVEQIRKHAWNLYFD